MDTDWMGRARCKEMDPGLFFPSDGIGVQVAQHICAECTVRASCLEYALVNRIDNGVWGGTSERERRRLLRKRMPTSRSGSPDARADVPTVV